MPLSSTVYHLWSILSLLLASFFVVHIYLFDRFQCFRWSKNGTSTFKRLMIYGYALSIPCIVTFSIGFSIITSTPSPPLIIVTNSNSNSTASASAAATIAALAALSHLSHPATIPLYFIFALGWALELSTHLEEFCFWLFLLCPPSHSQSSPPDRLGRRSKRRRRDTGGMSERSASRTWTLNSVALPREREREVQARRQSTTLNPNQNPNQNPNHNPERDPEKGGEELFFGHGHGHGHGGELNTAFRVDSPSPYLPSPSPSISPDLESTSEAAAAAAATPNHSWFTTTHFKFWLIGSLLSLGALMTVMGIYAKRNDVLKCEAATFLTGSILGLLLTFCFIPILFYFPQVIERSKEDGVEIEVIVRLVKFHELNVIRVFFRFLFLVPLLILAIDGIDPLNSRINRNKLWSDLLAMIAGIGCIVSSAITILIFFPRSTELEMARNYQTREERERRRRQDRSGNGTRGLATGTGGTGGGTGTERTNNSGTGHGLRFGGLSGLTFGFRGGLVKRLTFSDGEKNREMTIEPFEIHAAAAANQTVRGREPSPDPRVALGEHARTHGVETNYWPTGQTYGNQQQQQQGNGNGNGPSAFNHPYSATYSPRQQRQLPPPLDEHVGAAPSPHRYGTGDTAGDSSHYPKLDLNYDGDNEDRLNSANPFISQPSSPDSPPPPPAAKPSKGQRLDVRTTSSFRPPITAPGRTRPLPTTTTRSAPFPLTSHNLAMHTQMQIQADIAGRPRRGNGNGNGNGDENGNMVAGWDGLEAAVRFKTEDYKESVGITSFRSPLDLL